jgi:F-type H+-transporting ATPase subunit delta
MAEIVTIARPYAEAVFRVAKEKGTLEEWSGALQFLAAVVQDAGMQSCITDPSITPSKIEALFTSLTAGKISEMGLNFVKELIHNGRLAVLPQIAELYEALKAEEGGMLEARVISAYPMTKAQLGDLVKKLEGKFKKKVEASAEVDPDLIGGVKIEIGDDVIDASVRGKLQAMAFALTR